MTNYIRHLNAFFSLVRSDKRLTSSHVSLYMALFQYWNFNRFQNPFPIYRHNLMGLSKIGSKATYHKCIRELHSAQYIVYHPAATKFQPVKISIVRMGEEEELSRFKQLDLFNKEVEKPGTNMRTASVPDLHPPSIGKDTGTVPDLGHSLKQTGKTKNGVQHTPTTNFQKNWRLNSQTIGLAGGANSVRTPLMSEVVEFFNQHNQGPNEAQRFFYYNQGKSWMLTDKLPVTDWKAIAKKWMLNPRKPDEQASAMPYEESLSQAIQYLYERYLEGAKINRMLAPEYADHLLLEITDAVKQEAFGRRLNQLSGSNEASEIQLWTAYMNEKWDDGCVLKDQTNLTALAKKLSVLKYFQKAKSKGVQKIISDKAQNQQT